MGGDTLVARQAPSRQAIHHPPEASVTLTRARATGAVEFVESHFVDDRPV